MTTAIIIILVIVNFIILIDLDITDGRVKKLEAELNYLKFKLKDCL